MHRLLLTTASLLALLGHGCTAQSVTAPIDGEPVCADFYLGVTKTLHKGSLRRPVRVQVLDGDEVRSERLLLGRRTADAPTTVVVVQDSNESFKIRWQQCANIFAPKRLIEGKAPKGTSGYDCGEAKTYKEHELKVREGDPSSRTVRYLAPPEPACWVGTDGPAGGPAPASSASASADAAAPAATATAQTPIASASASATEMAVAPVTGRSAPVANPSSLPSAQP